MRIKQLILPTLFFLINILQAMAQRPTIEIIFSAVNGSEHIGFDSILVRNKIQGVDTTLYGIDTVLVLEYLVGIPDHQADLSMFQINAYPNPFSHKATIKVYLPADDILQMEIFDLYGRMELSFSRQLPAGEHSFMFFPGNKNCYLIRVKWRNEVVTAKLIPLQASDRNIISLNYSGFEEKSFQLKSQTRADRYHYNLGDTLLIVGYTSLGQAGILKAPVSSQYYEIQFATNIPCPGVPVVEYAGQTYNTIQIFSQCWLKENLNVGKMIHTSQESTDNDTIEKYCWDNDTAFCTTFGGYYQWDEMMQYEMLEGAQGICPPGWHVPTDEEWKILEGMVDSQYGVGDPQWNYMLGRGYDAGKKLKSTSGWYLNQNGTDEYGFTGLPAGIRYQTGGFLSMTWATIFWTSSYDIYSPWSRHLSYESNKIGRITHNENTAISIRCLKD